MESFSDSWRLCCEASAVLVGGRWKFAAVISGSAPATSARSVVWDFSFWLVQLDWDPVRGRGPAWTVCVGTENTKGIAVLRNMVQYVGSLTPIGEGLMSQFENSKRTGTYKNYRRLLLSFGLWVFSLISCFLFYKVWISEMIAISLSVYWLYNISVAVVILVNLRVLKSRNDLFP